MTSVPPRHGGELQGTAKLPFLGPSASLGGEIWVLPLGAPGRGVPGLVAGAVQGVTVPVVRAW